MTTEKDYFQTFCKLSQAFGTAATVDELLQLIVKSATETVNAKAACLFLADHKQDVFVPKASFGLSENYMHANPIKAKKLMTALTNNGHLHLKMQPLIPVWKTMKQRRLKGLHLF